MQDKGKKILVAEDDQDIREIIQYNLELDGFTVFVAPNGAEALDLARKVYPDLIILDIMMPRKSGIEVCEILRKDEKFQDTCLIMLTALSDDATHIRGLEVGADDFISKPISPKVLVSRVNALLRRRQKPAHKIINTGAIVIDPEKFETRVEGREVVLAKKEFELLYLLASQPGKAFLRKEILSKVWHGVIVGDRTIDVHIRKIRRKLDFDCIDTIKGVGYKFNLIEMDGQQQDYQLVNE